MAVGLAFGLGSKLLQLARGASAAGGKGIRAVVGKKKPTTTKIPKKGTGTAQTTEQAAKVGITPAASGIGKTQSGRVRNFAKDAPATPASSALKTGLGVAGVASTPFAFLDGEDEQSTELTDPLAKLTADLAPEDAATLQQTPPNQILESEEGGRVRSIRDSNGGVGTISAESPEALSRIRSQVSERFPGATGDGSAGSFNTISSDALIKGDTQQRVSAAALEAARRGEDITDIQKVVAGESSADTTESDINNLETRLSKMNPRSPAFKVGMNRLNSLRQGQKDAKADARSDRTFDFNLAKYKQDRADKFSAAGQKRADATLKNLKSDFKSAADEIFQGEDPEAAQERFAFRASQLAEATGDHGFTSTEGRVARSQLMRTLGQYANDERGVIDWLAKVFGGDQPAGEAELSKLKFTDWELSEGNFGLVDGIVQNRVIQLKDSPGTYVYIDNMPPQAAHLILRMLKIDNPEDFGATSQPKRPIRSGQ